MLICGAGSPAANFRAADMRASLTAGSVTASGGATTKRTAMKCAVGKSTMPLIGWAVRNLRGPVKEGHER